MERMHVKKSSPLNLDVDNFIHNKAIEFAKQKISIGSVK